MKNDRAVKYLPEDTIIDILSRLPAEHVLECRKVCKHWLALTSSPTFADLHLKRQVPVLIAHNKLSHIFKKDCSLDLLIIDQHATKQDKIVTRSTTKKETFMSLKSSCNGLLVLYCGDHKYVIYNPVTREHLYFEVPVLLAKARQPSFIAMFFHSPPEGDNHDYRLLFWQWGETFNDFYVFSLKDRSWRKLSSSLLCIPACPGPPVTLNNTLHWKSYRPNLGRRDLTPKSSIITFDTVTEELLSRPHPGTEFMEGYQSIHLGETKGKLSLCIIDEEFVNIWVLADYDEWLWVNNYTVDHNQRVDDQVIFRFDNYSDLCFAADTRPPEIEDGDVLLVDWLSKASQYYQDHIIEDVRKCMKLQLKKMYDFRYLLLFPYTKSFVSLRDFS